MVKKAIVTLAIGKKYGQQWDKNCKSNWEEYAKKFNYDLIVFEDYLDTSKRAMSRSPAWQKCLILEQEKVKKYDRVVWLDSDIIINNEIAPDVSKSVPNNLIGGVNMWDTPSRFGVETVMKRQQKINSFFNKKMISSYITAKDYYLDYGFKTSFDDVLQTGVMVLSKKHDKLLSKVYYNYEDKKDPQWHYEMRPLSYEIIKNKLAYFIDPRFNAVVNVYLLLNYPYLLGDKTIFQKVFNKIKLNYSLPAMSDAIETIYLNNYFIHFAGSINMPIFKNNEQNFINKKFKFNKLLNNIINKIK